jgi:hypothetical protein
MRAMIVKNAIDETTVTFEEIATALNKESVTDSQVLHFFLCDNDPGDNYTVEFKNV